MNLLVYLKAMVRDGPFDLVVGSMLFSKKTNIFFKTKAETNNFFQNFKEQSI